MLPCDDCFAFELFLQVCGVNHGGVGVDGVRDVVRLFDEDELRTSETDGAVECAAAADHDDFVLEAGGVRKLPNEFGVIAGDAGSGGSSHRTGCARGDNP